MVAGDEAFDVYVSFARADERHAADIDSALRARGLTSFFDRTNLLAGRPWLPAMEEVLNAARAAIILIGPHGFGNWQQYERGIAFDRQMRDPSFTVVPVMLPGAKTDLPLGFLRFLTWVDFSNVSKVSEATAQLEQLVAAVRGVWTSAASTSSSICPYKGLDAFREEDSAFFFGRGSADDPDSSIGALLRKVHEHPLTMVIGPSGSGKSSLVYAGLLPALRRERDHAWNVSSIRPGHRPFQSLAEAFNPRRESESPEAYSERTNAAAGEIENGGADVLSQIVRQYLEAAPGRPDRLLLFVDKWHELYSSGQPADKVNRFIDLLLDVTRIHSVRIVGTVRADFYASLIAHRGISDILPGRYVLLAQMSRSELGRVIVEPATRAGLRFEPPSLVHRILDDIGEHAGMLPLLQYALKESWLARDGSTINADSYLRIGGVQGAIQERAEQTFAMLSDEDRNAARQLFLQLVRPGDGREAFRIRAPMPSQPAQRRVAEQFAGSHVRLLVADSDNAGQPTIEIAHELLIRAWPRFQSWIAENMDFLRERAGLMRAKEEWDDHGRLKDWLLPSGSQLERAQAFLGKADYLVTPDIREFVGRSIENENERRREYDLRIRELTELARKGQQHVNARPEPHPRGPRVFISYRRTDTRHFAGRIFDYLKRKIDETEIFFDVETIPVGANFRQQIMNALDDSAVMLCVVGDKWVNRVWRRYPKWLSGFFNSSSDAVQMEIEIALDLGVPILPILVDDAEMPNEASLPISISQFSLSNAAQIRSGRSFDADVEEVLKKIQAYRSEGISVQREK